MRLMLKYEHTKALGFREGLSGTRYLRDAVNYILEQQDGRVPKLMSEVYPAVAKKRCKTTQAVERGIRHTISNCANSEIRGTNLEVIASLVALCREDEFNC